MNIFLSASIPDPKREPEYAETADVVAIREAVRGLATIVATRPGARLVWGGHPAITPVIRLVVRSMGVSVRERVYLYQSGFFKGEFPPENQDFEHLFITPATGGREQSLLAMRERMFTEHRFDAGIFIGGMKGVEEEWALLRERQPEALLFPIASTGAAAKRLFDANRARVDDVTGHLLETEYAYMSLFRRVLPD